jgi:hypothetical protein
MTAKQCTMPFSIAPSGHEHQILPRNDTALLEFSTSPFDQTRAIGENIRMI